MKNSKSEKSAGGSIIAAICIVIYLAALVQGAVRIYLSIEQRKITSEQEFSIIANLAAAAGQQSFMDEQFVMTINEALNASTSIEAIIITGSDGGYAFEKRTNYAITWVNNTPRFINRFSLQNQNLYMPLPIADMRNANIKAAASAFDFSEFVAILRDSLALIAIGLLISFITIIIQYLSGRNEKPKGSLVYSDTPEPKDKPVFQAASDAETGAAGPKGLYSPRSNIGWEEYTNDRLDSEIHRCASTEKDLALVLADFGTVYNDLLYRQIAEEAVNFFTSRDLVFEKGQQGITVILPGIGLDVAINRAEKFYQRVMEKFPGNFNQSSINIGLSSRSGRLLNGERLMLEANEAVKKAKSDSRTSIIAFKSDPEKYRAFVSKQE